MNSMETLKDLMSGTGDGHIRTFLLDNPGEWFSGRDLRRMAGTKKLNIWRICKGSKRIPGLPIEKRRVGTFWEYRIAPEEN